MREYSLAEGVLDVFVGRPLPERLWTALAPNLTHLVRKGRGGDGMGKGCEWE